MTLFVNVLLDRSGSMEPLVNDVIGHYNEYVDGLTKLDEDVLVSLSIFDTEYSEVYKNTGAKYVPRLDKSVYYARGGTALLDGVGRLITAAESQVYLPEDKVIFVINTDGYENSSKEYTKDKVKGLVEKHEDWQFVFVGAGLDNFADANAMGIHVHLGSTHTARGTEYGWGAVGQSTSGYSSGMYATLDSAFEDIPEEDEFLEQKGK